MTTPRPAHTYVIAVGIGRYPSMDSSWNALVNAERDAARFVKWACDAGVPPENVRLLQSANVKATSGIPAGVQRYRGTKGDFTQACLSLRNVSGELFYFFWAGHGTVDEEFQQNLFFEDTEPNVPQTLDLAHFWRELRAASYGYFQRQVGFVDVCAVEYAKMGFAVSLGKHQPGIGVSRSGISQAFILAADVGDEARGGVLSGYVLERLAAWSRTRAAFPPDADAIIDATRACYPEQRRPIAMHYKNVDGTGRFLMYDDALPLPLAVVSAAKNAQYEVEWFKRLAEIASRSPALGRKDDSSGRDALYGVIASHASRQTERPAERNPRRDLLQIIAFAFAANKAEHLVAEMEQHPWGDDFALEFERFQMLKQAQVILNDSELRTRDLLKIYRRTIKEYSEEPGRSEAATLPTMLDELSKIGMTSAHDYYQTLSTFLLRAAAQNGAKAKELRAFVASYTPEWLLGRLDEEVSRDAPFLLSIMVSPGFEEQSPAAVEAKLLFADTDMIAQKYTSVATTTWDEVEREVARIVLDSRKRVMGIGADERSIVIEFLLSDAFFARAPHRYQLKLRKEQELGAVHAVVVRWRERLVAPEQVVNLRGWRDLGKRLVRTPPINLHFLKTLDAAQTVLDAPRIGAAIFTFFPGPAELLDIVALGFPFIAWFEEKVEGEADEQVVWSWLDIERRIKTWLTGIPLEQIPQEAPPVRKSRKDFGRRMTLFWDDPERCTHWPVLKEVSE